MKGSAEALHAQQSAVEEAGLGRKGHREELHTGESASNRRTALLPRHSGTEGWSGLC